VVALVAPDCIEGSLLHAGNVQIVVTGGVPPVRIRWATPMTIDQLCRTDSTRPRKAR